MLWAHIIKKEAAAAFDYLILYQYFVHLLHLLFLKQLFHTDTERMSSSACLYHLFFRHYTSLHAFTHFPICSSFDLTRSSMVHPSGSYTHTVQVSVPPLSSHLEGLPYQHLCPTRTALAYSLTPYSAWHIFTASFTIWHAHMHIASLVFPTETQTLLAQALFVFMWVLFAVVSRAFRTDIDTELELIHSRGNPIIVSALLGRKLWLCDAKRVARYQGNRTNQWSPQGPRALLLHTPLTASFSLNIQCSNPYSSFLPCDVASFLCSLSEYVLDT